MIPVGYMAKRVSLCPEWIQAKGIENIYSVSHCISKDFTDYIGYWQHNGYWFFDSPKIIRQLAEQHAIDLQGTTLFYYEVYELAFDDRQRDWIGFQPEPSIGTNVIIPTRKVLAGYDIVTFSTGTNAECSPLSCNGLVADMETNRHCLLASLAQAQQLLASGKFLGSEPGPLRIFAVYSVDWLESC